MAYQAWSVIAGEQPTAAKWNILGTNDASFNDGTGIFGLSINLLTTYSNPYKFSVYRNAAISTTSSTFVKMPFDTELYDTNNNYATGTYTAPLAGFYDFNWQVAMSITNTDTVAALYKNGSVYSWGSEATSGGSSLGAKKPQLAANDTIDVYFTGVGTAAVNVGLTPLKTYFDGYLSSRT